jgi:hypothetical protein
LDLLHESKIREKEEESAKKIEKALMKQREAELKLSNQKK